MRSIEEAIRRLRGTLRRRGASHEDAEDCVQEAYLRYHQLPDPGAVRQPEGFLVRTALNAAIDVDRRNKRRRAQPLSEHLAEDFPGPGDVLEARERLRRLSAGMDRLNPRARRILLAHRLDGLSYAEIARREGISVKGVERSIARAVATLFEWMDED